MPNSINVRFPYDPTGVNPDNLIQGEIHSLTSHAVRAVAPTYGPFFTASLQVYDNTSDQILVKGTDYEVVEMLEDITLRLGKEVCNLILILNQSVSASVRITYQVVGGLYQNSAAALINMYETVLQDNRPVAWENVLGKPLLFPPTTHLHNLVDVYGFEPLVGALERVRNAIILSNIPAFEALIDWILSHLNDCCAGEVDARVAGDNALSDAIQQEILNRVLGDNNLASLLQNEILARIAADNELRALIASGSGGGQPYANTPIITIPANNSVIDPATQVFTCTMDSADITVGAYFEWQIATTSAFTTILKQTTTGTTTFVPSNLGYSANYYVRVRYVHPSPAITTAWSATIHCTPPVYANTPVITMPLDNSYDIPLTQVFTCTMASQGITVGAYFQWQIASSSSFGTILDSITTGTDIYDPQFTFLNSTTYYVRVRYVHPNPSITTAWSSLVRFTIAGKEIADTEMQVISFNTNTLPLDSSNNAIFSLDMDQHGDYLLVQFGDSADTTGNNVFIVYERATYNSTGRTKGLYYYLSQLYTNSYHRSGISYGNCKLVDSNQIIFITSPSYLLTDWKLRVFKAYQGESGIRYSEPITNIDVLGQVFEVIPINSKIQIITIDIGECIRIYEFTYADLSAITGAPGFQQFNGISLVQTIPFPHSSDRPVGSNFGSVISVGTNRFIVSAEYDFHIKNGSNVPIYCGRAYIYHHNGTAWELEQILTPTNTSIGGQCFGRSVSMKQDGTEVIVEERPEPTTSQSSTVYHPSKLHVYERNTTTNIWSLRETINIEQNVTVAPTDNYDFNENAPRRADHYEIKYGGGQSEIILVYSRSNQPNVNNPLTYDPKNFVRNVSAYKRTFDGVTLSPYAFLRNFYHNEGNSSLIDAYQTDVATDFNFGTVVIGISKLDENLVMSTEQTSTRLRVFE